MRRRTAIALGLAGLATTGLSSGVLPASAEVRAFQVTLVDGRVVELVVDVEPGTELKDIAFPDVTPEQILEIAELPPPPEGTPLSTPAAPAEPAPPAPEQPGAQADEPQAQPEPNAEPGAQPSLEPQAAGPGERQRTTGAKKRRGTDTEAREGGSTTATRPADREREAERPNGEAGMPAVADPATSLAEPGAALIGVPNFFIDKFRIPPFLLPIYQAAGMEHGIRWEILAAINEIETDYGRNLNVSSAGALGWMQFMPATWKHYGVDANGDGRKDPYNPVDAIFAAARYLEASGAGQDLRAAIFAYNHADWYVDSVLMRARLIGGMPADLVGSLTGLTQGRFPVDARARYAGGRSRRHTDIYARPGSPVVAAQDGRIVAVGTSARLGRHVQLRDAFGTTYTYAHLGEVARRHPVAKGERPAAGSDSVGSRVRAATTTATPSLEPRPKLPSQGGKERWFAHPRRPGALRGGSRSELVVTATPEEVALLDLPADQVALRRLRVGSRVVGGTVLGHVGRTSSREAPHLRFMLRPGGRDAPRIDPKPILDGWKLLESSAVYRAEGRNPFFGSDSRAPTIGQILLMAKPELEERVLRNPRIELYDCGARDVRAGRIDRRVLAMLEYLAASGLRPGVSSLQCGHSTYTASGNVSHHSTGSAVDIATLNGTPVIGHQGPGSLTDLAVRRLLTLQGTMRPAQIISLMRYPDAANTLAMSDHDDHIHVGFTPVATSEQARRQRDAVLRPGQWIKLVDRLGQIDNPTVRSRPSRHAITVRPGRASRRHRGE